MPTRGIRALAAGAVFAVFLCAEGRAAPPAAAQDSAVHAVDALTLEGPRDFRGGYPARDADGRVHAVIEIPAGHLDKWEVGADGKMHWELKHGQPRVVRYLGYPGNYGMVPRTLEARQEGGDGDPMDILVLGPPQARGTVMAVRVIGLLRMLDDGEEDSKLIGVDPDGPFAAVDSIAALDERFPGVSKIVETWFNHYKGPGRIQTRGYAGPREAEARLDHAIGAWRQFGP